MRIEPVFCKKAIIFCIKDTSRTGSNAISSFKCGRRPFGVLPQDRRLRHPCRRLDILDAAFEHRTGKEPVAARIIYAAPDGPLAFRLNNFVFYGQTPAGICGNFNKALGIHEKIYSYAPPGVV